MSMDNSDPQLQVEIPPSIPHKGGMVDNYRTPRGTRVDLVYRRLEDGERDRGSAMAEQLKKERRRYH